MSSAAQTSTDKVVSEQKHNNLPPLVTPGQVCFDTVATLKALKRSQQIFHNTYTAQSVYRTFPIGSLLTISHTCSGDSPVTVVMSWIGQVRLGCDKPGTAPNQLGGADPNRMYFDYDRITGITLATATATTASS